VPAYDVPLLYIGQVPLGNFSSLLGTTIPDPGFEFTGVDVEVNNVNATAVTSTSTFSYDLGGGMITQDVNNTTQFFSVRTFDEFGSQIGTASLIGMQMDNGDIDGANIISPPVCFVAGTLICCARGAIAVEELKIDDLVQTMDNGMQPIRWIGNRRLSASYLRVNPKFRPIRIAAGALGNGQPNTDLLVSPQHRILIRSKVAERMFGTTEVLMPAKELTDLDGIDEATDLEEVSYWHFMFDDHQVVFSNGAASESFYPGKQALKSVCLASRKEIFELFPELEDDGYEAHAARTIARGKRAERLIMRHQANDRSMLKKLDVWQ